jgi:chemotaxis protein MotB
MFRRTVPSASLLASLIVGWLVLSVGCVPKGKYDDKVEKLEETNVKLAQTKKEAAQTKAELQSNIKELDKRIDALEAEKKKMQAELEDTSSKLEEARGTLSMYESKAGNLQESLKATKDELEQLREQQQRQRERLQRYRDLAKKLAETFQSDQLSVKVRDGKMVIEMSDDVLFDSGRARVNENGRNVLKQLAAVLSNLDREYLIAGHTDNVPINSARFDDNWELSTARATNVVRFLQDEGVSPGSLAAAGYSKHDPIASNDTEKGRAKNRRIEIILMPKIDELPSLPDNLGETSSK